MKDMDDVGVSKKISIKINNKETLSFNYLSI